MKIYLLGESLKHSYSEELHSSFGYEYRIKELPREELRGFLLQKAFDGLNVTVPYKQAVIPYLDGLDETAVEVGAVNTIINRKGSLIGYNTDVIGLKYLLDRVGVKLFGKKVLILGTGGTAKTAAYVAKKEQAAECVSVGRKADNNYNNLSEHYNADIIINTTPVGMYPENGKRIVSLDGFRNLEGVADVIYNPLMTDLLFQARERNIPYTNGLPMLAAQAKASRDLFCGSAAPDSETERILNEVLKNKRNIVLTGMSSSGKSSIGRNLAERLKKPFVDFDTEIEGEFGRGVEDIFATEGEAVFRQAEMRLSEKFGKQSGAVISTGGGTLFSGENAYKNLKQNGIIVLLLRSPELWETTGRPLLADKSEALRLYEKRKALYFSSADCVINNDGQAEETVNAILEAIR